MRILIVKPGSIENIVRTLPAFLVTRKAMPRTEFFWVAEPGSVKIFRDNPLLDRLIEVVTKALRRGLVSGETLRAPRQQLRQLRASAFDLTLGFQLLLKSPSIARPSGAHRVFGFLRDSLQERIRRILLSKSFPASINPYTVRKNLSRAHDALGIPVLQHTRDIEFQSLPTRRRQRRRPVGRHSNATQPAAQLEWSGLSLPDYERGRTGARSC